MSAIFIRPHPKLLITSFFQKGLCSERTLKSVSRYPQFNLVTCPRDPSLATILCGVSKGMTRRVLAEWLLAMRVLSAETGQEITVGLNYDDTYEAFIVLPSVVKKVNA